MVQIFSRTADTWLRLGLLMLFVGLTGGLLVTLVLDRTDYEPGGRATAALNHVHHAGQLRSVAATATAPWRFGDSQSAVRRHLHDLLFADLENANVLEPLRKACANSNRCTCSE